MDIKKFSYKLSRMAVTIGLCLPLSYAQAEETPTTLNAGGQTIQFGAMDWSPGNLVLQDIIPVEAPVNGQAYFHTALQGLQTVDGDPLGFDGLNSAFEITINMASGVAVTPNDNSVSFAVAAPGFENFFRMYYDDLESGGVKSDALSGLGYSDGDLIIEGIVVELSGLFTANFTVPFEDLDDFGENNWPGTLTVPGAGGQDLAIMVTDRDASFFPEVEPGSIIPYNISTILSYKQTNPSNSFDSDSGGINTGDGTLDVGGINGLSGPDILLQMDPNSAFEVVPTELSCRVTGGGNDTAGIFELADGSTVYDQTVADGSMAVPLRTNKQGKVIGKKNEEEEIYHYRMGGQAGANTALPPQPKGEWTHTSVVQSPHGLKFTFHAGTASAPDGTEIEAIICTDSIGDPEGLTFCFPARPAPAKQIDFIGIGTFKNLSWTSPLEDHPVGVLNAAAFGEIVIEPNNPNQDTMPTYHAFQVHIEDLGEPGHEKAQEPDANCPLLTEGIPGSGNDPFAEPPILDKVADCGCGDFYHIKIYKAIGEPVFDEDGNITNPDRTNVIYQVYGYINGGDFQIHPLTGFDLH